MSTIPKTKKEWPRTIAKELHKQWRKMERPNDATKLANLLNWSKPTIVRALLYGHVKQQDIIDGINKFFKERIESEINSANEFDELQKRLAS